MKPPTYADVIAAGVYLASLEATRDQIAADLDGCESMRDKASLYLRLADVLERIESARPVEQKGDAVDEIAKRRAARRSSSTTGEARTERSS